MALLKQFNVQMSLFLHDVPHEKPWLDAWFPWWMRSMPFPSTLDPFLHLCLSTSTALFNQFSVHRHTST
jgi:hypothetical protein